MSKLYINTPFLKVLYACTSKPDKPFEEGAKALYKVILDAPARELEAFIEEIKVLIPEHKFKTKSPKIGFSKSEEGVITIRPSSAYKPTIFDIKGKKIQAPIFDKATGEYTNWKDDVRLGKDSIVRCNCLLNPHDKGVGLQLTAIQVKTLVEWESTGGGSPFGEAAPEETPFESDQAQSAYLEVVDGASALDI